MRVVFSILALSLCVFACTPKSVTTAQRGNKGKKSSMYGRANCPANLACTQEYRYVMVKWLDNAGEAVILDSISATRIADGHLLKRQQASVNPNPDGGYTLASDANIDEVSQKGTSILLQGFKKGKLIARNKIMLSHDCCHIINTNNILSLRSEAVN